MNKEEYIIVGKLVRPFGVKGEILFFSCDEESGHLKDIHSFYLETSLLPKNIEYWVGLTKTGAKIRCKLQHIDNPEAAQLVCGQNVMIPRADAAPLVSGEYYSADFISLSVRCDNKEVGVIQAISNDARPLLSIQWLSGKLGLIPFDRHFFSDPDLAQRTITLLDSTLVDL